MYDLKWEKKEWCSAVRFGSIEKFVDAREKGIATVVSEGSRIAYTACPRKFGMILETKKEGEVAPDMLYIVKLKNKFGLAASGKYGAKNKSCSIAIGDYKTLKAAKQGADDYLKSIGAKYNSFM